MEYNILIAGKQTFIIHGKKRIFNSSIGLSFKGKIFFRKKEILIFLSFKIFFYDSFYMNRNKSI